MTLASTLYTMYMYYSQSFSEFLTEFLPAAAWEGWKILCCPEHDQSVLLSICEKKPQKTNIRFKTDL